MTALASAPELRTDFILGVPPQPRTGDRLTARTRAKPRDFPRRERAVRDDHRARWPEARRAGRRPAAGTSATAPPVRPDAPATHVPTVATFAGKMRAAVGRRQRSRRPANFASDPVPAPSREQLIHWRREVGLGQRSLARRCGLSRSTIAELELGAGRTPPPGAGWPPTWATATRPSGPTRPWAVTARRVGRRLVPSRPGRERGAVGASRVTADDDRFPTPPEQGRADHDVRSVHRPVGSCPRTGRRTGVPDRRGGPVRAFLTVREAAALLEVSEDTIERACKAGELLATRLGRQWRIHAAPVHARRDGGLDWLLRQHGRLAEIREAHRQASELHRRSERP